MGCLKGKGRRIYQANTDNLRLLQTPATSLRQGLAAWPKKVEGNQGSLCSILTSISGMLFRFKGLRM